jgi:hypothetical protein
MTQGKRYVVLSLAVLAMGAVRIPFEQRLSEELSEKGLMPPKLEVGTGDKIGQTFSAVSLGGLRTLVATFMNLRAFTFFTEQKWGEVAETYEIIVDLAPHTRYYWDAGSWHQSYNAASYYLYESDLPALRRKVAWQESILAGRRFLERGIRNNPDDSVLKQRLGFLLADPNKILAFGEPAKAFEESYEAYLSAVDSGSARDFAKRAALYSLARVPGREKEALELAREIQSEMDVLPPPTVLSLLYILRYHADPDQPVLELVDDVFPSRKIGYQVLGNLWLRSHDRFPIHGVAKALVLLEGELGISEEKSMLNKELSPPMNPDDYFSPDR